MADFVPSQKYASDFNKSKKYENGDAVQAETVNNLIEGQLFVQGIASNRPVIQYTDTDTPDIFFDTKDGLPRFVFQNIKGKKGDQGATMRFVDGPLSISSAMGNSLNLGVGHILNPQNISVGDIVFDPYFAESGNGYLCIWEVTQVYTNTSVDLKGLGYVEAPKGADGADGKTPYIKEGNWYIGEDKQGRAEGFSPTIEVEDKGDGEHWIYITDVNTVGTPDPIKIKEGRDGVGIKSIDQTTENTGSSEINTITIYNDNNNPIGSFNIRNGGRGEKGDTITGIVQSVVSEVDGGTNQIKVMVSNGEVYTFEYKNGSKGQKGDNGNIMRFTDSALYYRSDVGVTTNISASNLINGGDVAQGDVVLDTHYTQGEEYYICIWEVTQVSSTAQGVVISLRGMGYVTSSKGGNVKIDVDDELSTTSTNPVQNKVVTNAINGKVPTTRTINGHSLSDNVTVTKGDVGLSEVANESPATIRAGLTDTNVKNALGYTPTSPSDLAELNKTLSLAISTLDEDVTDIKTGEVVVNKAENDSNGNKIISTYATKSEANARAKTIEYSWESVDASGVNPFKLNLTLKDANGNQLSTIQVDFPMEQMVIGAEYDKGSKDLILYTTDGQVAIPVDDIFDGLVTDSNIGEKTAGKANALSTTRQFLFKGDVSGVVRFDGSEDKEITLTVEDDSHNHVIGNIDNLQGILDGYDNKFLEVDADIGRLQDGKLDKQGGWIYNSNNTGDTPLYIQANADESYIGFANKTNTTLGYYGFGTDSNPKIYTSSRGYENLIHSGNIGSQRVAEANKAWTVGIEDRRDQTLTPDYFGDLKISTFFSNTDCPDGVWKSGINVKGWFNDYKSWQLASNSDNNDTNGSLYFRSGRNTSWRPWREIIDSNNFETYMKNYLNSYILEKGY